MKAVTDFIFLGYKITANSDCSHIIKRHLLLERKAMTNLDSPDEHPFSLQPLWGVGTLPVSGCRPVWPVASAPTRSVHGPQDHRLSHWALHPLASQVAQC